MNKIAITMRRDYYGDYLEPRDSISCDWIKTLVAYQIEPILIPNSHPDPVSLFKNNGCSGLILSNGSDVELKLRNGIFSGQERDITESKLLKYALDSNIPVLGVCRGMQFINIFFGGRLSKVTNHVSKNHKIKFILKPFIEYLKSSVSIVNSFHNFGVNEKYLPNDLVVWAISDDKQIEGIYHKKYNILRI